MQKLAVPAADYLLARGPFPEAAERALLEEHRIDAVVSKNSGGEATYSSSCGRGAGGVAAMRVSSPPSR